MSLRADLAKIAEQVPHGVRVLDVGCGEGRFCRMLEAAGIDGTAWESSGDPKVNTWTTPMKSTSGEPCIVRNWQVSLRLQPRKASDPITMAVKMPPTTGNSSPQFISRNAAQASANRPRSSSSKVTAGASSSQSARSGASGEWVAAMDVASAPPVSAKKAIAIAAAGRA